MKVTMETTVIHEAEPVQKPSIPPEKGPEASTEPGIIWDYRTISLVVLAVMSLLAGLYVGRTLLFPIVLATILNLLLSPAVRILAKRGIPEWIGGLLLIIAVMVVCFLAVFRLMQPASSWLQSAPEDLRAIDQKLSVLRKPFSQFSEAGKKVDDITNMGADTETVEVEVKRPTFADTVLSMTYEVLGAVFLTVVLLYFLLAPGDRFLEKLVQGLPTWHDKRIMVETLRGIERGVGRYLSTITVINMGLGTCIGIAMYFFGLPNPILWGVMAMFLNFIPYLGAMVGCAIIFIVSVATFDSMGQALWPPLTYFLLSALEGSFVTPKILGHSMNLNPVLILLSLAFWGWLWGIGGALLAVPILAIFKIGCDHVPSLQPLGKFMEA